MCGGGGGGGQVTGLSQIARYREGEKTSFSTDLSPSRIKSVDPA